jgi:hypothetical protein
MDKLRKSPRRQIIGFAVSMGCAAALHPSAAAADPKLYGLVLEPSGNTVFGSIDPTTGSFTHIGSASVPPGYYAPVFDPTQNAFYLTAEPVNQSLFSTSIDEINATTGVLTQITLPRVGLLDVQFAAGLGVGESSPTPAAPEPTSLLQLLTFIFIFGIAVVVRSSRVKTRSQPS